ALRDAHISPDEIDYINVHGTSTPLGDVAEIKALQEVFGDKLPSINISSTKSMHGHLLGATGAVEALACVMTLTEGVVAPTINCRNLVLEIPAELILTLDKAQMRVVKYALSNSFGFGGHNATIILKKYQPEAE
ncbi:MAG: beta-ketoacyl-[Alistipes sp.]|nr:beta-ketoacyl-[acyl-carrier-protein] synthase II [Alistipes sp.]